MFEFLVIGSKEIKKIVEQNYLRIIELIAETYVLHTNKKTINPDTSFLKFAQNSDARIAALPAYVGGSINRIGIKWIASFPKNIEKNIARASAILILNDTSNGLPIACLESSIISAARTAASAVLGAFKLNNNTNIADSVAFIGNGIIAKYIFDFFIATGWKIDRINLFDLKPEYSKQFSRYVQNKSSCKIRIFNSFEEACQNSNLVVLATTSSTPYINQLELFSHCPIILNISLRDIHPKIILESYNIVDDIDHCLKAETSLHLAKNLTENSDFINGTIGEILTEKFKLPKQNITKIYSPFGMGMLDIALGEYIYQQTKTNNGGRLIENFFHDQARW